MVARPHHPPQLRDRSSHVRTPSLRLLQKHNKKIFDMCNVGEDYHLGLKRNEVLRECNRILDREDF